MDGDQRRVLTKGFWVWGLGFLLGREQVDGQSQEIERLFSENAGMAAGVKESTKIAVQWETQVGGRQSLGRRREEGDVDGVLCVVRG